MVEDSSIPTVFAVDIGGGSVCGGLFRNGEQVGILTEQMRLSSGGAGTDLDLETLWATITAVARGLLAKHPDTGVDAISVTGIRHALIAVHGQEVVLASSNMDRVAIASVPGGDAPIGAEIRRIGGRWPTHMSWYTKLVHWKAVMAGELEGSRMMGLSDWVVSRLSGAFTMSASGAVETCLFDVEHGYWSAEARELLDLDFDVPQIVPETEVSGHLNAAAGAELGLPAGIPVINCSSDSHAALAGVGLERVGDVGVVAGTTSPCFLLMKSRPADGEGFFLSRAVESDAWLVESNPGMTGLALDWGRRVFGGGLSGSFSDLEDAAGQVAPGCGGLRAYLGLMIPLPDAESGASHVQGLVTDDPRSMILSSSPRGEMARAVFEAAGYATAHHIRRLREIDVGGAHVTIAGGQTQSRLLMRIIADTLGQAVSISGEEQPTLLGAAYYGGLAIGAPWQDWAPAVETIVVGSEADAQREEYFSWLSGHRPAHG